MNGAWEEETQEHCEWVHEPGEHCALTRLSIDCERRDHRGRGCRIYYLPRLYGAPVNEVHVTGCTLYDGGKRK